MRKYLAIMLLLTGCYSTPSEMKICEDACRTNGGCKWVDKTWFLMINPPKYNCENGARFEKDVLERKQSK